MTGCIGIVVLLAGLTADAPVQVYASVEPPEIPFHRTAVYRISVEAPATVEPVFPDLKEKYDGLEIEPSSITADPLPDGRRRITHAYKLDPIQAKTYLLPPAEVTWADQQKAIVPGLAFEVRELTKEEEELAGKFEEIAGPEEVKPAPSKAPWIAAALTAAVLGALGMAGYLYWKRRQSEVYVEPPIAPWEVAYRRLRELAQRKLAEAGKYEPYYVDLSAILRYYIEDRFQLRAPEQTTPEFLEVAGKSRLFSEDQQGQVARFLRHCDRVKFARYEPNQEEMEQHYAVVMQFVRETEIKPMASPGQEVAS